MGRDGDRSGVTANSCPHEENFYVTMILRAAWDAVRSRALFSAAQHREAKASESVAEERAAHSPCARQKVSTYNNQKLPARMGGFKLFQSGSKWPHLIEAAKTD